MGLWWIFVKQVLELLSMVLNESRESDERWRRWSRQIVDTLLPLLAQGRVRLESRQAQHSLQRVLTSVAPCILRPVDSLLRTLFTEAPQMVSCVVVYYMLPKHWVSKNDHILNHFTFLQPLLLKLILMLLYMADSNVCDVFGFCSVGATFRSQKRH